MKRVLFPLLLALIVSFSFAQTWQNPMTLPGQLSMGIGDPYIFKFRGTYYLYSSSRTEQEIRCWTSKDLVNWTTAVVCCNDASARSAYAPEVVYWNGTFYMYTSPAGNGHYVLTSNSPTGPFVTVTENLGKKIDGSIFIDDDGKWYFYHANVAGILGCAMTNPTTIGESLNLNAQMLKQWTEGPQVIKRHGMYYMIYTGNHVWSNGYRIDYGINKTSNPIGKYTPQDAQNPILIKTEGNFIALGHGTAFIGPDLDTYYYTYHNLVRLGGGSTSRQFNYDRMAWNGDKLLMLGATTWGQQAPALATTDYFDREDLGANWNRVGNGNWTIVGKDYLSQDKTGGEYKALFTAFSAQDYTAEFTLREKTRNGENARIGAVFSYTNEQNYGLALLNSQTNKLEISFLVNNQWSETQAYSLPSGYNYAVWHSMRIEKSGNSYRFLVDGMNKAVLTSPLSGGQIGYISRQSAAQFSYIAINDKVEGSGIFDTYKPVPGDVQAVHYNSGSEGSSHGVHNRADKMSANSAGGFHISGMQPGQWYKYNVNMRVSNVYNLGVRYASSSPSARIKIWQGETVVATSVVLPGTAGAWQTFTVKDLPLKAGHQTLKIEAVEGELDMYELQFREGTTNKTTITDTFDTKFASGWNYTDGTWQISSGQANINGYGKRTIGNVGWTDYTIDCDITYVSGMNAGLIFRVNNPANGGENNNPQLGTDFLQGYYARIGADGVALGKHNYGWESLASYTGSYYVNRKYHMRVVVKGANIKIYVDDMTKPKIDYTDPNPIISGKLGFRSHFTNVLYNNLSVVIDSGEVGINSSTMSSVDCTLYPNPVKDILTVETDKEIDSIRVYDLAGELLLTQLKAETVNLSHIPSGMYIVQVRTADAMGSWKITKW